MPNLRHWQTPERPAPSLTEAWNKWRDNNSRFEFLPAAERAAVHRGFVLGWIAREEADNGE